jgi:hypothetical protein
LKLAVLDDKEEAFNEDFGSPSDDKNFVNVTKEFNIKDNIISNYTPSLKYQFQ